MPTLDELIGTPDASPTETTDAPPQPVAEQSPTDSDEKVQIVEWVNEIPKPRRSSPFDPVIEAVRQQGDTERAALIDWPGKKITPNKVNFLRQRFPDCDFTQVTDGEDKKTYVRLRTEAERATAAKS
jgi:hypothetical protein